MANTRKATTVILIGLYFTLIEASPTRISKTINDPSRCDRTQEDQNLPHEADCSKYYRCVYGKKVPKLCHETMLFNPEIGNCDLHYNVECPFKTLPEPEDDSHQDQNLVEAIEHFSRKPFTNKRKSETTVLDISDDENKITVESENSVSITKPSDISTNKFVYMPHEFEQTAYYKFENGERNILYCEEGMVFSIDLEICARPWGLE